MKLKYIGLVEASAQERNEILQITLTKVRLVRDFAYTLDVVLYSSNSSSYSNICWTLHF